MENKSTVTASLRITEDVKQKLDKVLAEIGGKNATERVEELLNAYKKIKQDEVAVNGLDIKNEMKSLDVAMENITKLAYGIQAKANTYAQQININLNKEKEYLENVEKNVEEKIKNTIQAMADDSEKIIIDNMTLKVEIEELEKKIESIQEEKINLQKNLMLEIENKDNLKINLDRAQTAQKVAEEREIKILEENKKLIEENKKAIEYERLFKSVANEMEKSTFEKIELNKSYNKLQNDFEKIIRENENKDAKINILNKEIVEKMEHIQVKAEEKTEKLNIIIDKIREELDNVKEEKHQLELEILTLKASNIKQ